MLKRLLFPLTLLLCLAVATTSCRDDDDGLIDLPEELVSGPIRISVPENPWRIKSAADYYAFYVECQGSGWIATCESEWLTLTPTEGSESQYIRFDVEEHGTLCPRGGHYYCRCQGAGHLQGAGTHPSVGLQRRG